MPDAGTTAGVPTLSGAKFFALLASRLDSPSICPGDRPQLESAIASLSRKSVRRRFAKLQRLLRQRFLKSRDASGHEHKPGGRPDGGQFTGSGEGGGGASKPEKPNRKPKPDADSATGPAAAPAKPPERSGTKPGWPEKPAAGGQGDAAPAPRKQRDFKSRKDARDSLRASKTVRNDPLGGGVNDSRLIQTADGTLGVFKSASGEGYYDDKDMLPGGKIREGAVRQELRKGVPKGTYYQREVAASYVAGILGFGDLVPPTAFRKEGNELGSMQAYVGDSVAAENAVKDSDRWDGDDLPKAAALDYLFASTDRHPGNWLVVAKEGGTRLALIDNGLSFPDEMWGEDAVNVDIVRKVVRADAAIPDLSRWKDKWPEVDKALRACGLKDSAINLAKLRFEALAGAKPGSSFRDLPHPFIEGVTMGLKPLPEGQGQSETGPGVSVITPEGKPEGKPAVAARGRGHADG